MLIKLGSPMNVRKRFLGDIDALYLLCIFRIETSTCLTVSICSRRFARIPSLFMFAALVCIAVHLPLTGVPGVGLALLLTISIQRALPVQSAVQFQIIINHRRRITVLRPRFGALFLLATRQVLLSYHLFIMLINWQMAGACGSGESSRRAYLVVALLTAKGIKFSAPHSAKRRLTTLPNLPVLSKEENYKLQDRPFTEN
jgi:hypothetical protein